ncbi:hypothetical protein [Marinobacterium jannaschii]|uniref:hypothetical protein n=1 Tax=Marinobacterium jannaschii TaxID=64970 RepID=UPI0012EC97C8|nr:hypothetical protein [Marinobacterium jannaschii]
MSTGKVLTGALVVAMLQGCGGGGDGDGSGSSIQQLSYKAWNQTTGYASALKQCALAKTTADACTVGQLAPLGTTYTFLTVDRIAERVVSSHSWMARNFLEALRSMPMSDLALFKSVTAIVIGHDIRPSYYTELTGAIYLDGTYLWTSAEEAADLSSNTDARLAYGKDLKFVETSRYLDSSYRRLTVSNSYNAERNSSRTISELKPNLFSLLAHELAHAADLVPPEELGRLDSNLKIYENVSRFPTLASEQLHQTYPLNSAMMHGLAGVFFQGKTATSQQKMLTAAQAGTELETEGSNDLYAYSSASGGGVLYEDTAMLFEEIMMRRWFDAHRDLAFLERPATESIYCNDYMIGWGQRNRMADPSVQVRAKLISDRLLPGVDLSDDYASYSTPTALSRTDWCDSNISSTGAAPALQLFNYGQQVREEVIIPEFGH